MSKPEKGAPRISPELLAKAKGAGDNPRISPELLGKATGNPRISPELLAKAGDNPRISPELLANRDTSTPSDQPAPAPAAAARPEGGKPGGSRRPPSRAKQSVPISVFLGILLVPLSAAASLFLVSPQEDQAVAATEAAVESVAAADPLAQDLATACGPAGAQLVEIEQAGTITDLQQAALDALRPICDQNGLALPDAPSGTDTAGTVVVTASNSGAPAPAAPSSGSDDHDDDWDDDHDDDDDDWDDDHDDDDDDRDDD